MVTPIISTKVNIPHTRADVVMRPRVMALLNEGLTRPSVLTLVLRLLAMAKQLWSSAGCVI
jgi:hypothetical protein